MCGCVGPDQTTLMCRPVQVFAGYIDYQTNLVVPNPSSNHPSGNWINTSQLLEQHPAETLQLWPELQITRCV